MLAFLTPLFCVPHTYATDTSYKLYHFLEEHILKNNIIKNLVINNRHSALFGLNSVVGKKN